MSEAILVNALEQLVPFLNEKMCLSLWFVETTSGLKHFRKWPLMALPMAKSKPW